MTQDWKSPERKIDAVVKTTRPLSCAKKSWGRSGASEAIVLSMKATTLTAILSIVACGSAPTTVLAQEVLALCELYPSICEEVDGELKPIVEPIISGAEDDITVCAPWLFTDMKIEDTYVETPVILSKQQGLASVNSRCPASNCAANASAVPTPVPTPTPSLIESGLHTSCADPSVCNGFAPSLHSFLLCKMLPVPLSGAEVQSWCVDDWASYPKAPDGTTWCSGASWTGNPATSGPAANQNAACLYWHRPTQFQIADIAPLAFAPSYLFKPGEASRDVLLPVRQPTAQQPTTPTAPAIGGVQGPYAPHRTYTYGEVYFYAADDGYAMQPIYGANARAEGSKKRSPRS